MAIQFNDPETTLITNNNTLLKKISASPAADGLVPRIPTSEDVTGIELRMLAPYIKDNRTPAIFPFPGYSDLYCLTIVISDVDNQLAGNIDLKGFHRIGDREHLPINKTIFYWQSDAASGKPPSQIHVFSSVMKCKKALREVGEILTSVKNDDNYKSLIGTLKGLATDAARFNVVTDVITQVAGIVGGYLKGVDDKPLGTVINSYTTLNGDFDKPGASPLSYPTRNVDFNFQMVVRSLAAQKALVATPVMATGRKRNGRVLKSLQTQLAEPVYVDMRPL